jgi:predicted nucleotidyltransferase
MVIKSKNQLNVEQLTSKLLPILKRHHVAHAGIFGSMAEGTSQETSDIDLVIEFNGEKSLLDLIALKLDLEAKINRKVDVMTYKALNPLIRNSVLENEVKVL